jgi:predicted membrane protein
MLQNNSIAYGTPVNWMAYLGCIIVATIVGIVTYSRGGNNSVLAAGAALILLGISAIAFELVMLWIVVFLLIIYCGWTLFGERR